jgi:dCMP deaminase
MEEEKKDLKKVMLDRLTWDEMFMNIAILASQRSSCRYYKVGAVFIDRRKRIVSIGYNNSASGDYNCNECGCQKVDGDPETGEITPITRAVHAEINGILNSYDTSKLINSKLYITVFPCYECMKVLINAGIKEIVYLNEYIKFKTDGTQIKESEAMHLARRMGLNIRKYENNIHIGKIYVKELNQD